MTGTTRCLPPFAETYVAQRQRPTGRKIVLLFHRWLEQHDKHVGQMTGEDVERFAAQPGNTAVGQMTRNDYRYEIRRYLRWLVHRRRNNITIAVVHPVHHGTNHRNADQS
jgi:hypothetical protein